MNRLQREYDVAGYRLTLALNLANPGEGLQAEWAPRVPSNRDPAVVAEYKIARDDFLRRVADEIGGIVFAVEVGA